jgi:hypothetical protein
LSAVGCVSSADGRRFARDRVVLAPDRSVSSDDRCSFADVGGVHAHDGHEPAGDGCASSAVMYEFAAVRGELSADARKEPASMDAMPERVRFNA